MSDPEDTFTNVYTDRGWGTHEEGSYKYHYFPASSTSLCGQVTSNGITEFTPHTGGEYEAGPEECGLCMRSLASRGIR